MANKLLLNRRFVRKQAVLNLYAFYIRKQANYQRALTQLKEAFIPDLFANPGADARQLAKAAKEAAALFAATVFMDKDPVHDDEQVTAAVTAALKFYKKEQSRDKLQLEKGLEDSIKAINKGCILVWQLLAAWIHLAQQHDDKPKLAKQSSSHSTKSIAHSLLLSKLQDQSNLSALAKQAGVQWEQDLPEAANWYQQFVSKNPQVVACLASEMDEHQLIGVLLDSVIFGQEAIQAAFEAQDLHWSVHKRLVKNWSKQALIALQHSTAIDGSLQLYHVNEQGQEVQAFYVDLIHRTLHHEADLEEMIAAKSANWTVDRIMVLDKAILTLALCEIVYFPSIPTKVSINEYLELTKTYGITKMSQFINGILDAAARTD